MARTKGMLNLSGNLEVNAQAPLDARTIVPTEADLTVASNFPYPYVGLEVYVTGTNKKFRLVNLDTTQSSSWHEIGEGGGGQTYNDFTGATASTAGAHGLVPAPSAGDEGKVLFGNGAWGALPSVDLSVLSNEAFIFEEGEKPVGMWTNRKLLWQKTVRFSTPKTLPANTWATLDAMSNGEDIAKVMMHRDGGLGNITGVCTLAMESNFDNGNLNVIVGTPANSIYAYTIQYTKTTDSPLPSGVKFAGVTASGEVILERTLDFGENVEIPTTNWYTTNMSNSNVGKMIGAYGVSNSGTLWNLNANCDSGNYVQLQVCRHDSGTSSVRWATVKYTLAS